MTGPLLQLTFLPCDACGHCSEFRDVVLDVGRRVLGEGTVPACWNVTRCAARRIGVYGAYGGARQGPAYIAAR